MARVTLPSKRGAEVRARMVFWFTTRALDRLAGQPAHPVRMVEPLRGYAHLPGVLRGYAKLEQATAGTHRLDRRHQALAELQAATLTRCPYCIELTHLVALENLRGRFNLALGIEAAGFSQGRVCALPTRSQGRPYTGLTTLWTARRRNGGHDRGANHHSPASSPDQYLLDDHRGRGG